MDKDRTSGRSAWSLPSDQRVACVLCAAGRVWYCVYVSFLMWTGDADFRILVVDVQKCSPEVVVGFIPDDLFGTALSPVRKCHVTGSQV